MKEKAETSDFVRFLNRNYYIASHLAERLEELTSLDLFAGFQKKMADTMVLLELQLGQTDRLFETLNVTSSLADCEKMIALLESVFTTIQDRSNGSLQLSLLDYLSLADSLMKESAKLAVLSLNQLPKLALPQLNLYNANTLQPLKVLLENSIAVQTQQV